MSFSQRMATSLTLSLMISFSCTSEDAHLSEDRDELVRTITEDLTIDRAELIRYAKKIGSTGVESLLEGLKKDELLGEKVYVYKSGGIEQHEVDESFPRVLVSINYNAWLTFSGKPDGEFTDTVAYIPFIESKDSFEIAQFKWDTGSMVEVPEMAETCKICHTPDVNLLWPVRDDDLWPGMLGSTAGIVPPPESTEDKIIKNLRKGFKENKPEYRRYKIVGLPKFKASEDSEDFDADIYSFDYMVFTRVLARGGRVFFSALNSKGLANSFVSDLYNCSNKPEHDSTQIISGYFEASGLSARDLVTTKKNKELALERMLLNLDLSLVRAILMSRSELLALLGVSKKDIIYWQRGGQTINTAHEVVSAMRDYVSNLEYSEYFKKEDKIKFCNAL